MTLPMYVKNLRVMVKKRNIDERHIDKNYEDIDDDEN